MDNPESSEKVDETLARTDVVSDAAGAPPPQSPGSTLAAAGFRPLPPGPPAADAEALTGETLNRSMPAPPSTRPTTPVPPPDPESVGETMARPASRPPSVPPPSRPADPPTRLDPFFQPAPPPETAASGAVPGYEVLGVLGQGGMGIVYKARHVALDRVVALKMILRGALADQDAVERFRIEAQAVARLRHPNIVQIFEVGEYAGQPYFSLEYLEGGSLHQKLQGAPQAPRDAARLLETLARAVHHAHEQNIIHRDLKPANVLLTEDGTPKVTDFGLAKRIEEQDQNRTAAEVVLGTPTYMAPEQASGKTRNVGPPADVYSLGAILYDLLTGRPPLRGTTVMDTLQLVQTTEPVPPRRLQPKVPQDLQTICLKCLEKDPRRRYASAEALADDLHRFLEGRPIEARPVGWAERTWKWARRRPAEALLALACVAGLIGLIAALAVFAGQQGQLARAAEVREKQAHDAEDRERKHGLQLEEEQRKTAAARDEAAAKRALAENNLGQARQAIGELLEVSEKGIPNEPHLEGLRERILVFARDLAHNLLAQQSDDPEVQAQAAQTTRLVGDIQESLNKLDDAAASYDAAAGLYEGLLKAPEPKQVWREEAAGDYLNSWKVLMARDKGDDARKALDRAVELLQALAKEHPEDGGYQRDLALCWNDRGIQYLLGGDGANGRQSLEEALGLFERMPPDEQRKPETQLEWAKTENNLGTLYQKAGRYDEAEAKYRHALDRLKPLVLAEPDSPVYQKEFGPIYVSLGALLSGEGPAHYAEAEAVYDDAIAVCGQLGEKFRGVADYRVLLANAYYNRGELFRRRGDIIKAFLATPSPWEAACDVVRLRGVLIQARGDLEQAHDLFHGLPNRPEYRVDEARVLNQLAEVESGADPAAARRSWEQALALCEALPDADGARPDAGAELRRAALNLIAWYTAEERKAQEAKRWPEAVADARALVDLRRKRLAAFASSRQAQPAALGGAAGVGAAWLSVRMLQEEERGELASTLVTLAAREASAGAYDDAAAVFDALARPGPDVPSRWARYPQAAAVAANAATENNAVPPRPAFLARSLALLRRAAAEGVTAPPGLLNSKTFDPLRDSAEFQQLQKKLTPPQ